ncbi:MAG TPA: hypothetical protein VG327_20105 [Mycobacterium sp.]|jgi:hypothetical protein|nr:hypothetical protein [Mycobacterium sp.]
MQRLTGLDASFPYLDTSTMPGRRAELSEICGHIASLPLDRHRPPDVGR